MLAWGEVRYTTPSKTLPTRNTFTGQYSYVSDDATDLGGSGFGLMFYQSRFYDPSLGRFAQADTIVPGGSQGLDRYAYVNNSPTNFVDPTGHFTRAAIYNYLFGQCLSGVNGEDDKGAIQAAKCASAMITTWETDTDWWSMITDAQAGDVLFGSTVNNVNNSTQPFTALFVGNGTTSLTGIDYNGAGGAGITLTDIQDGHTHMNYRQTKVTWMGFFRPAGNFVPTKWHIRPGYEVPGGGPHREDVDPYSQGFVDWAVGAMVGIPCEYYSGGLAGAACTVATAFATDRILDGLDMNPGDVHFMVGPLYFNFEVIIGGGAVSYSLEKINYSSGYCKFSQCP